MSGKNRIVHYKQPHMAKKEKIYTCIDLTKKEVKKLKELLEYEQQQLESLIRGGEEEYQWELDATRSIRQKLKKS